MAFAFPVGRLGDSTENSLPLALGIPANRYAPVFLPRLVPARNFDLPHDAFVCVVPARVPHAYPLSLLDRREAVNDRVDGVPILVARCTLCRSTQVYSRSVDGRTLTFGVSGNLLEGAQVLYDRETGSLWRHRDGVCVRGVLLGKQMRKITGIENSSRWGAARVRCPKILLCIGDSADNPLDARIR